MLRDLIPAKARQIVYQIIAAAAATEAALDAVGWGVIPTDVQAKALVVLAALGLLAAANTPKG